MSEIVSMLGGTVTWDFLPLICRNCAESVWARCLQELQSVYGPLVCIEAHNCPQGPKLSIGALNCPQGPFVCRNYTASIGVRCLQEPLVCMSSLSVRAPCLFRGPLSVWAPFGRPLPVGAPKNENISGAPPSCTTSCISRTIKQLIVYPDIFRCNSLWKVC